MDLWKSHGELMKSIGTCSEADVSFPMVPVHCMSSP
jgi:hypothetical protein